MLFGAVMCRYKDCGNERERHVLFGVVMCQYKDCCNERERGPIGCCLEW